MDEILRGMQDAVAKNALERFDPLPMRMGMERRSPLTDRQHTQRERRQKLNEKEMTVAKVIEFYQPLNFRKPVRWIPPAQRGKVLEFRLPEKKTA